MSAQAVIDSLEFARTGQTLRGSLPVSGLTRLQDDLYDALGEVEFVAQGDADARQRLVLMLDVADLIEDEVLLGLPYAPRHDEGCCTRDAGGRQQQAKPSPFAKLVALKKDL